MLDEDRKMFRRNVLTIREEESAACGCPVPGRLGGFEVFRQEQQAAKMRAN